MLFLGGIEAISLGDSPYSPEEAKLKLQLAQEHGSYTFEWCSRKATGEIFWTDVNLRRALIGNQKRIVAAVRDISERKEAAEKLREANERLLLLIDRMPLGCVLWSPEFTVNLSNPAAESIFGFTERGNGRSFTLRNHYCRRLSEVEIQTVWAKLMSGDTSAHSVNVNLTKSGEIHCL